METSLEKRARRAARRVGFVALKRRWRRGTIDNRGGFQVLNPMTNWIVAGERFDVTPEVVRGAGRKGARA